MPSVRTNNLTSYSGLKRVTIRRTLLTWLLVADKTSLGPLLVVLHAPGCHVNPLRYCSSVWLVYDCSRKFCTQERSQTGCPHWRRNKIGNHFALPRCPASIGNHYSTCTNVLRFIVVLKMNKGQQVGPGRQRCLPPNWPADLIPGTPSGRARSYRVVLWPPFWPPEYSNKNYPGPWHR